MHDSLVTIPVSEVFEPREGCPLCRLRDTLEQRVVEYITGAAMMEPDIRIQTNKQGFCHHHFEQMLKQRNRLSVALMLESHLNELDKQVFAGLPIIGKSGVNQGRSAGQAADSCFVCDQNAGNGLPPVGRAAGVPRPVFRAGGVVPAPFRRVGASFRTDGQEAAGSICRSRVGALPPVSHHAARGCVAFLQNVRLSQHRRRSGLGQLQGFDRTRRLVVDLARAILTATVKDTKPSVSEKR